MQAEDWLREKKLQINTRGKGRSTVITVTPLTDEELRERGR